MYQRFDKINCLFLIAIFMFQANVAFTSPIQIPFVASMEEQMAPPPPQNLRILDISRVENVAQLILDLKNSDPTVSSKAAKDIFNLKPSNTDFTPFLSELIEAITNENVTVKRYITGTFVNLGDKSYNAASTLIIGLNDKDIPVRRNCASALGAIGPSASFAVPSLLKSLSDTDMYVRAYAARALGNIHENAKLVVPSLTKTFEEDASTTVKIDVTYALAHFGPDALVSVPNLTSILKDSKDTHLETAIGQTLMELALCAQDLAIQASLPQLQKAEQTITTKANGNSNLMNDFFIIERAIKYLQLLPHSNQTLNPNRQVLSILSALPETFDISEPLFLNETPITIQKVDITNSLCFLSESNIVDRGLNWLSNKKAALQFWKEDNQLKQFNPPYSNSFAIISAIDDYGRRSDITHKGSTGYRPLSEMVHHAQELAATLQDLGFSKDHIIQIYNSDATSTNITVTLRRFWSGGDLASADRLFFYFGGHGSCYGKAGCLITYDFNPKQPTLTSLLMHDITSSHFENIAAHHMLVAIDSCEAGLAIPQMLGSDLDQSRLKGFRTLSIIQGDTEQEARNLIVSGTGDQEALWLNGGVFTEALIDGLKGGADLNNDGVIQFDELALYLKDEVRARTLMSGVKQEPNQWKADNLGHGSVIFITNKNKPD